MLGAIFLNQHQNKQVLLDLQQLNQTKTRKQLPIFIIGLNQVIEFVEHPRKLINIEQRYQLYIINK